MRLKVGSLQGGEQRTISAVNIMKYRNDVERMVKASPSEQVTSGLRPEGQEEADPVKTAGGAFHLEGCAGLELKRVGNTRMDGWHVFWV